MESTNGRFALTLTIDKYTAKTFTDTASSGTPVTAADLNRHEAAFSDIYDILIGDATDTGWTPAYSNNSGSYIQVRRIGLIVNMRWKFSSCNGTFWKVDRMLHPKFCPSQPVSFACVPYDMGTNNVGFGYVATDGRMYFNDWFGAGAISTGSATWFVEYGA